MLESKVVIELDSDGRELTTTVFQLLQWKHALKLEKVGLTMSRGRKVSTHLRKLLGLKRTYPIEALEQWVQQTIDAVEETAK